MGPLRFYFDLLSPYAYLAFQRVPALAQRHGRALELRPVDLAALKLAAGNTGPANREMPVKHRHLRTDLRRWAALYGVPFVPPAGYGSARLNRGALLAVDRGCGEAYAAEAWRRVWGLGGAMDDDALIAGVAAAMGWHVDEFMAYVGSPAAAARLAQATAHAAADGVFGVPTMVADGEMWWGNDRLDFVERHLAAARG